MNDTTIFQADKWSSHFVKKDTFQNQLCDSENGSLIMIYLQCSKSNAYHWYAFDSLTYRIKMVLPPYNTPYVQQVILCMSDSDALI